MTSATSTTTNDDRLGSVRDDAIRQMVRSRAARLGWFLFLLILAYGISILVMPDLWSWWLMRATLGFIVALGAVPTVAAAYQYAVIGFHRFRSDFSDLEPYYPRVAIILPCWNEESVVGKTIDRLLGMEYPSDRLRVYAIDDASTDRSPLLIWLRSLRYPGRVFHLRRENGGQGKAHTLNYGIKAILADDWAEAVLIMDADVLFDPGALRRMTRHLSDPTVGAVTGYIKEGSADRPAVTRFIAYEYITAQAAARRAQNIFGALACLAGGAQLHSRENLEAIGGRIDTSSMAEDTATTLKTQLNGRRVVFDGNAVVWAEEPGDLVALWKQRLRWARGNVHISLQYARIWFGAKRYGSLGRWTFGLLWFAILLMPVFMVASSVALLTLAALDAPAAWVLFRGFWIVSALTYLFVTFFSFGIDSDTARRTWFEGFLFPGIVSFLIIAYTLYPPLFERYALGALGSVGLAPGPNGIHILTLFSYLWLTLCMGVSYLAKVCAGRRWLKWLSLPLLYLGGFGPFLCAVTAASYWKELFGARGTWDKTIKTGRMGT